MQVPLITVQPKLSGFSYDAQNEAVALRWGAKCAVTCASVRKEPLIVRAPLCILNTASSIFTLTENSGAERKL